MTFLRSVLSCVTSQLWRQEGVESQASQRGRGFSHLYIPLDAATPSAGQVSTDKKLRWLSTVFFFLCFSSARAVTAE